MKKLKIALITDIHYGRNIANKFGEESGKLLRKFNKMASDRNVDLIIDLGDRISCRSRDDDIEDLKKVTEIFNKMAAPRIHVMGNHDLGYMSRDDNEKALGYTARSHSMDIGDIHIVVWNPNVSVSKGRSFDMDEEHIEWLENDLAATDKPVLLLSHIPLDYLNRPEQNKMNVANDYFYKHYANSERIQKILEDSGKNFLNLAGDHHKNSIYEIGDAFYITFQSLVQKPKGGEGPASAYAYLEIENDTITVEVFGQEPVTYRLKSDVLEKFNKPPAAKTAPAPDYC